jgi:V/A-type H+/Na+-transporting ATPase subunit I
VIVPMKRVTVVMLRSQHERSLALLQDLGTLHLASEQASDGEGVARARARVESARSAVEALRRAAPNVDAGAAGARSSAAAAEAAVDQVMELSERLERIEQERSEVERELERVAPMGDFDPHALQELARRGVGVRLLRAPARWAMEQPQDVVIHELGRQGRGRTVALVGPLQDLARAQLGEGPSAAEELSLPARAPAELRAQRASLNSERERTLSSLQELARQRAAIEASIPSAEDRLAYERARAGSALTGPLAVVRGFCPAPTLPLVEQAAQEHGWGLFVEDVDDPSDAPTEITMPRWVRPIRALFSFTGVLPGYDQVDVSVPFLLFMSLFFAMIVGDAGYGLLFLGLTEFGRWRMPSAPRAMFSLLRIMSVCTVVWGVLTGSYFGIALLPHPLKALQVSWLTGQDHLILLSFLIGAIHLTVAHGWNVLRFFPSPRALAQLGWIFTTWTMFFLAREMVLGAAFPHVMLYVLVAGIVLIVLFMTPPKSLKSEWFNHVMLPLSLVSNFVDLVSYVRLFAVGAATFAIAEAFNQMAVGSGVSGIVAGVVAALVLFFGHTLNILLATMGVLVHGVRLNMLEFASHLGMEWTGRPYRPFAHTHGPKEGA